MHFRTSGRTKPGLDILLWRSDAPWEEEELRAFVAVGVLDKYLGGIASPKLSVNVHFPDSLRYMMLAFRSVVAKAVGVIDLSSLKDYKRVTEQIDADIVVAASDKALPTSDALLVVNEPSEMLRQIELMVRGFDVPYSFNLPIYGMPWTNFYLMCDRDIFDDLIAYHVLISTKSQPDAAEFARALIYNTLPNVLFTRDRYDFYVQQKRMARRRNWDQQDFTFERAYALNNFYLLTYAAMDQLALVVNSMLALGIDERRVGFSSKVVRKLVAQKHTGISQLMESPDATKLSEMLDVLRNHAAHRGSLMPTRIYDAPEKEPTDEELDQKVKELGLEEDYAFLPSGELREFGRAMARLKARLEIYEVAADQVLIIDRDGKRYIVNPSPDQDCERLIKVVREILQVLAGL